MDRKTRIILMGRSAAGKTTICQCINQEEIRYHKTQTVSIINQCMIDTPGEYLERQNYRGALMVTATDADIIILVQDATENGTMFPPAFGSMFAKPAVGVVTKKDLADETQVEKAKKYLSMAGAQKIFVVSGITGEGMPELVEYLNL